MLEHIQSPSDLKKLQENELPALCSELRSYLIDTVLKSGGHFAANLGTVELAVALHYVFSSPEDPMIWDVGHQAYPHKVLTGRREKLSGIRHTGGISGFPSRSESEHDVFGAGHSSTSISAALGMAMAAKLDGSLHKTHIAVVGDGALSGGMAWEALNNAACSDTNLLVVINDNNIGIDPNPGALNHLLSGLHQGEGNFFTDLGFRYSGPVDGHDIQVLLREFKQLKDEPVPRILHVRTVKGKGYAPAEAEQTKWHSTARFVKVETPAPQVQKIDKYQDVFGHTLAELAGLYPDVVGITPAMPTGSGMILAMEKYPDRFFDVGIAEQHAVTCAAGMAAAGKKVFVSLYSTFMQRAVDQIIHDVALQNLPVVFCLDRAGLVGEDGPTHHGAFDISLLSAIPNIRIASPANEAELRSLMHAAARDKQGPMVIRYPKGNGTGMPWRDLAVSEPEEGKVHLLKPGVKKWILSTGTMSNIALRSAAGSDWGVAHFPWIRPLDAGWLQQIAREAEAIIAIEDGSLNGGFGYMPLLELFRSGYRGKFRSVGLPDRFVAHGSNEDLYREIGLDETGLRRVMAEFSTLS